MINRYFAIFFISFAAVFLGGGVFAQDIQDINEQIKELEKKIQRAEDVEAIKQFMTAMQFHFNMLDGNVSKTAGQCFGQNDGYMYGNFIGRSAMRERGRKEGPGEGGRISAEEAVPGGEQGLDLSTFPSYAEQGLLPQGFFTSLDFHILTTSVIEIAEDGQTARAVWYSPGTLSEPEREGNYMSAWIYELYACDFVKEDGEWKSWHRTLATDFMTSPDKSWSDAFDTSAGHDDIARVGGILESTKGKEFKPVESPEGKPTPTADTGKDIQIVAYQTWTPDTQPQYKPKPPEPYKTFNETSSYCPPMPKDLEEELWSKDMMF